MNNNYCNKLLKYQPLSQLRDEAQREIGSRPIVIHRLQDYPSAKVPKSYGRYEQSSTEEVVWIDTGLPPYVARYVLAHELCHILQKAWRYPRISLTNELRNFKISDNDNQRNVIPGIIVLIHRLSDLLTDLLLDRCADALAKDRSLVTKQAINYIANQAKPPQYSSFGFETRLFHDGLGQILNSVRKGINPSTNIVFDNCLMLVIHATVYANLMLRISPYRPFNQIDQGYIESCIQVQNLGKELARIALTADLNTTDGCKCAKVKLVDYLGIPQGIFS